MSCRCAPVPARCGSSFATVLRREGSAPPWSLTLVAIMAEIGSRWSISRRRHTRAEEDRVRRGSEAASRVHRLPERLSGVYRGAKEPQQRSSGRRGEALRPILAPAPGLLRSGWSDFSSPHLPQRLWGHWKGVREVRWREILAPWTLRAQGKSAFHFPGCVSYPLPNPSQKSLHPAVGADARAP